MLRVIVLAIALATSACVVIPVASDVTVNVLAGDEQSVHPVKEGR